MTTKITHNRQKQAQVETSHEMITEGIVAALDQENNTGMEKDTPLFWWKLCSIILLMSVIGEVVENETRNGGLGLLMR